MVKYFKKLDDAQFNVFQSGLNTAVTANGTTWGIPAGQVTALDAACDTYGPLYAAIVNKKTRTSVQVDAHRAGRTVLEDLIEPFANQYLIPNPLIADGVLESLGFNRRSDDSGSRPAITAEVFCKMEALAGTQIQFICRTNSDSSRASIAKDADAAEVRYKIGTRPTGVSDCEKVEISTKSRFKMQLPDSAIGQYIYAFVRWRNNTDVAKSGPWSDMITTVVRS